MTALRRAEGVTYAALAALAIAASCAKAENSPLADQGGDDEGGENGGGRGGSAGSTSAGTGGSGATGGSSSTGGSAGKGGTTSTGGSAGRGGTTSTGGSDTGGSSGSSSTTYGCLDDGEGGAGGEGGASGGAPGQAGAGGAGPGTLFVEDFEDGNANGWIPTAGNWGITTDGSEVYEQTNADSNSPFFAAFAGTCWADQIVEARVNVVSFNGNSTTNSAGLFARYVNAQTHYLVGMDSGNNGELFIGRRIASTSNAPDRIVTKTNMRWVENEWHSLRLEVIGSTLKAYLDDNLELETTDTQITSGGVAVGVRHAHARFDDVRVTVP